jgi:hypothetical protein
MEIQTVNFDVGNVVYGEPRSCFFGVEQNKLRYVFGDIHDKILDGDVGPALFFEFGPGVDFVVQLSSGNQIIARRGGIVNAVFEGEIEWGVGIVRWLEQDRDEFGETAFLEQDCSENGGELVVQIVELAVVHKNVATIAVNVKTVNVAIL